VKQLVNEKIALCLQQLMTSKSCSYQAESVDELTDVLESVAQYLEERNQEFHFTLDGATVFIQLP
jgi:hypothetical protein